MKWQLTTLSLYFALPVAHVAMAGHTSLATGPLQQSIDEVLAKYDEVIVVRRLNEAKPVSNAKYGWSAAEYQILDRLKTEARQNNKTFVAPCRKSDVGREIFLLAGLHSKSNSSQKTNIRWKIAQPISVAFRHHVVEVAKLEVTDINRLKFFGQFLLDSDSDISANAALEFTIAADNQFANVSAGLDRVALVAQLHKPDQPPHLGRLYLAILSHCGNELDAKWLQSQIKKQAGSVELSAWIGCYLALAGEKGLAYVDRQIWEAPKSKFIDRYSVLQALRFVRDQFPDNIPRDVLLNSFRKVLDNEELADLVIRDLAVMKDWGSLDRLVAMYEAVDAKWIRTPIVNFVRVCPLRQATEAMEQLEKIDPAAVKRALRFWTDGSFIMNAQPTRIRIFYRRDSVFHC